jgi:effector-binding domain-containing protein
MDVGERDLLSIGRFSRLSGLTVKALRHYADIGLLTPADVDASTGYRFYRHEQLSDAVSIRRLRGLDVPLEEVGAIISGDEPRGRLIAHRARLEQRAADTARVLRELTRLIDGEEELVPERTDVLFEMNVKEFEDQPVLSIRERVRADALKHVIPAAYEELFGYLGELGEEAVEPWTITVCPFADSDGMVEIDNNVCVAGPRPGRGRIESRILPACTAVCLMHRGPYDELSRSYRGLSEWIEHQGLTTAGAPREIYWTDPKKTPDPADYVTEIAWPIVPNREKLDALASTKGEKFTKPLPA